MKFRPCIDIHDGKIKQIVGGTLTDQGNDVRENFTSEQDGAFYAGFYKKDGLKGGHVILLNAEDSPGYEATKKQAAKALGTYPGGFQAGGSVTDENAAEFLELGASHVIVTSFVFRKGQISFENLEKMLRAVGRERLVLDLSCKKREGVYYIVTDRWQNFTDVKVEANTLDMLSGYCDEFLIHGVDVEGTRLGVEEPLLRLLGDWEGIPVTYAGGIGSFADLEKVRELGRGRLDVTIGSALDLFGGSMAYREVLRAMD